MSTITQRKVAAICGALVGDAAAMPLHWVYNQEKLDGLLEGTKEIEFRYVSANPFYILQTGYNSSYGDQTYFVLKSLVKNKGLNIPKLKQETVEMFGPGTEYDNPNRASGKLPVDGRWLHASLKESMELFKNGSEDTASKDKSADCYVRAIPVVAMYAGRDEMLDRVRDVIRVTQQDPEMIAAALGGARILESLILNGRKGNIVEDIIKELSSPNRKHPDELDSRVVELFQAVLDQKPNNHTDVATQFGRTCYVPGNLQTALHSLVTNDNLQSAVRTTMRAGGCTSSRSGFIGACMGAQFGLEGIPDNWKQKTFRYQEALQLAENLVNVSL